MMQIRPVHYALSLIGFMMLAGCQSEPAMTSPSTDEQYNRDFIKHLGAFEPRSWNAATRVSADIAPEAVAGAETVNIYSSRPGTAGCKLIASYPATERTFLFDLHEHTRTVYAEALDTRGRVVMADLFNVSGASVDIDAPARSRALTEGWRPAEVPGQYGWYNSTPGMTDLFPGVNWYGDMMRFYDATAVMATRGQGPKWNVSEAFEILGTGKVFAERGQDADHHCNLLHYYTKLNVERGVEYVLEADDRVTISQMFAGTQAHNLFGYFYYTPSSDPRENLRRQVSAPKYIMTTDYTDQAMINVDGAPLTAHMSLQPLIQAYENLVKQGATDSELRAIDRTIEGTDFNLAYFGPNYDRPASAIFPAGTHIAFFCVLGGSTSQWNDPNTAGNMNFAYPTTYSIPAVNDFFARTYSENHGTSPNGGKERRFVTYRWGNQVIMGFEDTADDDMNDILFFVKGRFQNTPEIPDINPSNPVANSWIVGAEDLGGTFDFDFNDLVFGVSHVAGQKTATITALASGGNLPVYLVSEAPQKGGNHVEFTGRDGKPRYILVPDGTGDGEFHRWFGKQPGAVVNAHSFSHVGKSVEVLVNADFTLTEGTKPEGGRNNMGGFSIQVKNGDKVTNEIQPPTLGKDYTAPQMFLVATEWKWPTESTKITSVYGGFVDWTYSWWDTPAPGSPYVNHGWQGAPIL